MSLRTDFPHEYRSWVAMRSRCSNPSVPSYKRYGGRGICVCPEWGTFAQFLKDMGPRPTPFHSIDRFPKQDGNYEPSNCRWATDSEQNNNKSNNRVIDTPLGAMTIADAARAYGLKKGTLHQRISRGMSVETALDVPVGCGNFRHPQRVMSNGCFDILTYGHVAFLAKCREMAMGGPVLVALNTDESVARLKPGRPINCFDARRSVLLELRSVDHVVPFTSEPELIGLIQTWRPDVLAKGQNGGPPSDAKQFLLQQWGGRYIAVLTPGIKESTTDVLERLRKSV